MAPLTGFRRWYSPAQMLRANSWILMVGSLGMVAATLPVQWLLPLLGWRPLFWGMAALLLLAMVLIARLVPPPLPAPAGQVQPPAGYGAVWRFLAREGLTFKKKPARRRAAQAGRRTQA
jgi:MFS family permease